MILIDLGVPRGKFADVIADPLGWTVVCQDEASGHLVLMQLHPDGERRVPDVTIAAFGGNAFPVLKGGKATWLAYRDEKDGHGLLRNLTAATWYDLGQVHGNCPIAFGEGYVAYQATADYVIEGRQLAEPTRELLTSAKGRPTGLAAASATGVTLIDDLRFSVPGMVNPRRAGRCVVGENADAGPDRNIARLTDGRECELWPGMASNTPQIATDGHAFAVATWGGPGVRVALLTDPPDFREKTATPKPSGTPVTEPKALGYWFDHGRPGDFWPACNSTILGSGLYKDGDGQFPDDLDSRLASVVTIVGRAFLDWQDISRCSPTGADLARSIDWRKVLGVFIHEPGTVAQTQEAALHARENMRRLGLPPRPVIAVLGPTQSLDAAYSSAGVDAIAAEVYFDAPEVTWDAQVAAVDRRVSALVAAHALPLYLVVQSYDRDDARWKAAPWALEAIQAACNAALAGEAIGLWWFAYARPGGVLTYPKLEFWHAAQVAVTQPPTLVPPVEKPMFYPNDDQCTNMLQRISISFVNDLQRPEGIFGVPPDGLAVAITRPDGQARIDTKALAVWLGRYFHYFNEFQGDHERAARKVESDLFNSDEAKAHRPQ